MPNPYFQFKQFTIYHDRCAMKVTTDACLFGAWCAKEISKSVVNSQSLAGDSKQLINNYKRALDIGTGTGLLSLMVAQKNSVTIDAIELEANAATQAAENVRASSYAATIHVHHTDIIAWGKGDYEIIFSNPPFYENELPSSQQQKNIAHHGEGLRLETLFSIISEKLSTAGQFYLLLPYKRKDTIERLLKLNGLFIEKEVVVKPVSTNAPFRLLLKGCKQPVSKTSETTAVYTADKQYTSTFIELLQDYYLYL